MTETQKREAKKLLAVNSLLAHRVGRLQAAVFVKEWMSERGITMPSQLSGDLVAFCEQPVQDLTQEEITACAKVMEN